MKIRLVYKVVEWVDGGDFRGKTIHSYTEQFDDIELPFSAQTKLMDIIAKDDKIEQQPESWRRWSESKESKKHIGLMFDTCRSSPVYFGSPSPKLTSRKSGGAEPSMHLLSIGKTTPTRTSHWRYMLNPANDTDSRNKANMSTELILKVKAHHPNGWIVYFTPMLCKELYAIYKRHTSKHTTTDEAVKYTRRCLSKAAQLGKFGIKSNGNQVLGNTIEEGFIIENE